MKKTRAGTWPSANHCQQILSCVGARVSPLICDTAGKSVVTWSGMKLAFVRRSIGHRGSLGNSSLPKPLERLCDIAVNTFRLVWGFNRSRRRGSGVKINMAKGAGNTAVEHDTVVHLFEARPALCSYLPTHAHLTTAATAG